MKDFEKQLPGFFAEVELLEKKATEIMERGERPGTDAVYCGWKKNLRRRVNEFSSNEYLYWNEATKEMVLQDPNRPRIDEIEQKLKDYENLIESGVSDIHIDLIKLPECELPP